MKWFKPRIILLITFLVLTYVSSLEICETTPKWKLGNSTFPADFRGRVKIVALLRSTCGFCRVQAARLENLQNELIAEGKTHIRYVIVNPAVLADYRKLEEFRKLTSIPILQDTQALNLWDFYKGITDDMFIFDRCNRLVSHLSLPDSHVISGKVKSDLLRAYDQAPCGRKCGIPSRKVLPKI